MNDFTTNLPIPADTDAKTGVAGLEFEPMPDAQACDANSLDAPADDAQVDVDLPAPEFAPAAASQMASGPALDANKPGESPKGKKAKRGIRSDGKSTPDKDDAATSKGAEIEFYFDKTRGDYWRKRPSGDYLKCNEKDLKRHCQRAGMNVLFKQGDMGLTRFEMKICDAQDNAAVDHAIPLAGHRAGIFTTDDGRRILVPHGPRLIVPAQGEFPNVEALHLQLFGLEQTIYIFAWLKAALEDLHGLNPSAWHHSQMLALVGKPNCGKSFYQLLISKLLGGRTADPYLWMVGKSDFNEDIAESEHLMMEDKHALRDSKSRSQFGTAIKQLTVSSSTAIHGKGKKMFTAPAYRRLSFSVNEDADYITALPMLDESVGDKLMLVKCSKADMLPDYSENMARFVRELPAFVHHLLHEFQIPERLRDVRFGIVHYHNPDVVEMLQQFDPFVRFREALDTTLFNDGNEPRARMTAQEILAELHNGRFGAFIRSVVCNVTVCGQMLAKCQKEEPSRFTYTKSKGVRRWTILAPRDEPSE